MKIIIGNASSSRNNGGNENPGDKGQETVPDYLGEVNLVEYSSMASFNSSYSGWIVNRPRDPAFASTIAQFMITACNNANIGYEYGSKDLWCTGGDHKVDTTTPCSTDCAALVCECVAEAINDPIYSYSGDLPNLMSSLELGGQPVFFPSFTVGSEDVYNGDIVSHKGHALMVVGGNPREGQADENPGSTAGSPSLNTPSSGFYGDGVSSSGYSGIPVEYNFSPRVEYAKPGEPGYEYYTQNHGGTLNGQYAWSRFAEVCKNMNCTLSKSEPKKWFSHREDGYKRGVAPSLGGVMCFAPRSTNSDAGFAAIVEYIHADYIMVSFVDALGKFRYVKWTQRYDGMWNLDITKDASNIGDYIYQGCIYPPNVEQVSVNTSKLYRFIDTLVEFEKENRNIKSMLTSTTFVTKADKGGWSAAFITACARKAGGILGVCLPDVYGVSDIGFLGVQQKYGEWFDGPCLGGSCIPQVGDIAIFRNVNKPRSNKYAGDQAGVVIDCTTKDNANLDPGGLGYTKKFKFTVVTCTENGYGTRKDYHNTSRNLAGIFRPYWQRIDGTSEIVKWTNSPIGMYNEGTTIEDAAIRDIAYAERDGSRKFKPSISETGIVISAINYTGMLSNMYSVLAEVKASENDPQSLVPTLWDYTVLSQYKVDIFATEPFPPVYPVRSEGSAVSGQQSSAGQQSSTAQQESDILSIIQGKTGTSVQTPQGQMPLNGNSSNIFRCLYNHLKNRGAVIGIMANMWQESAWNPGAVNKKDGGSGLIQWTDTVSKWGMSARATNMKSWVGSDWATNVSKQIDFLFVEAESDSHFKEGLTKIRGVTDNLAGAIEAMKLFLRYYEIGQGQWGTQKETTELTRRTPFTEAAWQLFIGTGS